MISKDEKEFLLKSSKHIKTNHQFDSLEKTGIFSQSNNKIKKENSKKIRFIGGGVFSGLALAGAISLIVIFTGRYENVPPLRSGEIENFSTLKGFGVAGEQVKQNSSTNNARQAKNLNENKVARAFDVEEYTYFSSPVNFYELTRDDELKKANLKTENGNLLNDYHVSLYYEDSDFIKVSLNMTKNLKVERYYLNYINTTVSNFFSFSYLDNDESIGQRGSIANDEPTPYFGHNYLISKRSGKIYSADNVLPDYTFGHTDGDDYHRTVSFKDYEDGYPLMGLSRKTEAFDLFLAREINNEIKIELVLNSSELRAFVGSDPGVVDLYIDRYGNTYYGGAAYINKKIVNDVQFDSLNRTIYKTDEDGYPCYLNKENEFIRTYERGRDVRSVKPNNRLTSEEEAEQEIYNLYQNFYVHGRSIRPILRKDNYILIYDYKCTLLNQESEEDYREYKIESLPVPISSDGVIQNNNIYSLSDNKVYVLDINTLEYKEYDCGGNRINSLTVNSHGDIILKGYAKDELKEITAYIVDGEFTFEYKDIESENLTYYVKPLN
ncbi:MAG: DUF1712 domain-containing protein [Bacilli bacterium]|nr:DUF1712 domain-containing protein [Bacilli bacterium]